MTKVKVNLSDIKSLFDSVLWKQEVDPDVFSRVAISILLADQSDTPSDRPRWEMIDQAVSEARAYAVKRDPSMISHIDMGQAALRDTFDIFGLEVTNEWHLYAVLVTCQIFAHMAGGAKRMGQISENEFSILHGMIRGLVVGLSDFVPKDNAT